VTARAARVGRWSPPHGSEEVSLILWKLPSDVRKELITLLAPENVAKIQAILDQQDQNIL